MVVYEIHLALHFSHEQVPKICTTIYVSIFHFIYV